MAIQGGQRDLIEVDETDMRHPRAGERGGGVRADAAAADNYNTSRSQLGQAGLGEEDTITG